MAEKEKRGVSQESAASKEKTPHPLGIKGADALIAEALESMESRNRPEEPAEEEKVIVGTLLEDDGADASAAAAPPAKKQKSSAASSEEVEALKEALESTQTALTQKEEQRQEIYDSFVRLNADFDNFRKRSHREKEEMRKYGHERVCRDLLEVFDNFERALGTLTDAEDSIRMGIEMVHRQFLDILKRYGVERFEALNQPFDYTRHEAISMLHSDEVSVETVHEVYQPGYTMYERLLRPAMVVVAKPTESSASKAEASNAEASDAQEVEDAKDEPEEDASAS